MKKSFRLFVITLILVPTMASSQNDIADEIAKSTIGFELDALPYVTGGYYGSVWYGLDRVRFRGVIAKVETPEFILEEGFENNKINAYAFIVDYFL